MLVNRIIQDHLLSGSSETGGMACVSVDRVYIQDGNSPTIAQLFKTYGFTRVFDPARIAVFFDHSVMWPNVEIANRIREAMHFCNEIGLRVFRGGEGISHVVALEEGWFAPGSIVLGTDSHTCFGGANQALALGMGASDVVATMQLGETWLRVPQTVRIRTTGAPSAAARPKDVLLYALSVYGQRPFLYKSLEWTGDWVRGLKPSAASTIASMAVDFGAKCAFVAPGPERSDLTDFEALYPGPDATLNLDITGLPPFVSKPHNPANGEALGDKPGALVNYVFIGSCTNSSLDDLAEAAGVLAAGRVHRDVHCIVTPGSRRIYEDAIRLGYIEQLIRAGAVISPPGCGACLGTQGSIPADGDRIVSTMNRNFLGRMGNPNAEIYLASPLVAATAAVSGRIPALAEFA